MKGIVFNLLNEMVEERFGFEPWEEMLEAVGSDGVFVATESYPDEVLMGLVAAASGKTNIPQADLVRAFGEFMVPAFRRSYPVFFEDHVRLKDFLLTVDRVTPPPNDDFENRIRLSGPGSASNVTPPRHK